MITDEMIEASKKAHDSFRGIIANEGMSSYVTARYRAMLEAAESVREKPIFRELGGITLGEKYIGKITEQEALDLVNEILRVQHQLMNGECEIVDFLDSHLPKKTLEEFLEDK